MTRRITREVNRVAAEHGFHPGEYTNGGHLNLVAQFRRAARGVQA